MQRFEIVHEFEGHADDYWKIFFRDDYNRALYDAVEVKLEVERDDRRDDRIERTVRYQSTKEPPAIMKAFLPNGLGYVERGTFDRATQRFEHAIEPNGFEDRAEIRGSVTLETIAPNRFRRTYAGTVTIRVPMLGGKLETTAIEQMKKNNDVAARVTAAWLARGAAE